MSNTEHNFPVGAVLSTKQHDDWTVREPDPGERVFPHEIAVSFPVSFDSQPVPTIINADEVTGVVSVPSSFFKDAAPSAKIAFPPITHEAEATPVVVGSWDDDFNLAVAKLAADYGRTIRFEYHNDEYHVAVEEVILTSAGRHVIVGLIQPDDYRSFRVDRIESEVTIVRK